MALADCTSDNSPSFGGSRGLSRLRSEQGLTDSLSLRVAGQGLWERILTVTVLSPCPALVAVPLPAGQGVSWLSLAGVLLPLGSGWNPGRPRCPVPFLSLRGRGMILPEVFSFSFN